MNILKRLYSIWILLAFFIPLFMIYPVFFVAGRTARGRKIATTVKHFWAKIFYFVSFMPVKIIGKENIKKKTTYVFASNHTSFLDIPVIGLLLRGNFVFIGKKSLSKFPVFGYIYKKYHILFERGNKESSTKALQESEEAVKAGTSVVFFPEATTYSPNPPELLPFKDGAFRLAISQKKPIVPEYYLQLENYA